MTQTFVPHDYQHEIIDHICGLRRCGVWAPMGGGKTVSTLTALENLSLVEDVYPALVLAPLRVANSTWVSEPEKWEHLAHLRVSALAARSNPKTSATAAQRLAALRAPADIYTMPYDNLEWLRDALGGKWPFRTVVADEWTRLKSFRLRQGGSRARALGKMCHAPGTRFIGLTGTPAPNGIKDLWGQMWFVDKGARLGQTFTAFEQRWFRKDFDGYGLKPMPHAQAEVEDLLRDVCLTVRGLTVDEPIEHIIYVDLPPDARRMYAAMEKDMFAELEAAGGNIGIEALNGGSKVNKCRQIANGFVFDGDGEWHVVHDEKIKALESVIEEASGASVLISYVYIPDKERILKAFRSARYLDADPATERRWNAGEIAQLVAHPASAGHGLNLQYGGNILADFGLDWNLEHDAQIIERIGPQRQKQAGLDRPVYRYRIVARNTIEEWGVLPALREKKSVQEVLLAALERRSKGHGLPEV